MAHRCDRAHVLKRSGRDEGADVVRSVLRADPARMAVLSAVRSLSLADGWVAAGFVRAAVWDALHGFQAATPVDDIDVIHFDPARIDAAHDRALEDDLKRLLPGFPWSVRNQARMHARNGDRPYLSSGDAMMHWLETPTAVGVALREAEAIDILAPFGLDDLLGVIIRPTPHARHNRLEAFRQRVRSKPWLRQWPRARLEMPESRV